MLQQYLSQLVSFKTVTAPNNPEVLQLYDWIEEEVYDQSLQFNRITSGEYTSLIIDTSSDAPEIILSAHIDVVPASETMFSLREEYGKYIGRGVIDMKFAAACYMLLLKEIPKIVQKRKVRIVLTSDEEVGGKHGVGYLTEHGYFAGNVVILPDGGTNFSIMKAEKGVIHCRIERKGIAAHGAYPWRGNNALEALIKQAVHFVELFPVSESEHSWKSTASITMAQSGLAVNQIPDSAALHLDIRFTEEYTLEQMKQRLKEHFSDCTVVYLSEGECVFLSETDPYVQSFITLLSKETGGPVDMLYEHGASDARYLSPHNIPVIMTKPLSGGEHTETEWIDINSLTKFYEVLKKYLQ